VVMRAVGSRVKTGALKLDENAVVETPSLPENQVIKIAVEEGIQPGTVYEVSRPLMTIGRLGGGADIQIDDPEVSRFHCSIEVRRDSILLQDLRSKNGTYFDGSRIFATRLDQMSRFRIGGTVLRVDRIAL
jgi:pSer/pThr/pTyr-binding forkhead associated (FHA) protein